MGSWVSAVRRSVRRKILGWTWLQELLEPLVLVLRKLKPRRPRRWRQPRLQLLLEAILWPLALALFALATVAVAIVAGQLIFDDPPFGWTMVGVDRSCKSTGFACTVASSIFFTVAPLAIGTFVFLLVRMRRLRGSFRRSARDDPTRLVETAGAIVGEVVGRDDICDVLQHDLSDRRRRRPHVIVGGVGVGKTAVLVRLTELLAKRGAVPVPIRLRDAQGDIDFLEMARQRFLKETEPDQRSRPEGDRVWLRLRKTDQVVVVADGLEEALAGSDTPHERDHRVRVAVRQARKLGYPLVIASRAHDALTGLDAAQMRLEPLSQEAALDYINTARRITDEHRLGWIVDRANVVETPLYLQLTRELHASGQLRPGGLETRGADRVQLRMHLLESWVDAMIQGKIPDTAGVPLSPPQRLATVVQLAALACCGLDHDALEVTFDMFERPVKRSERRYATPEYPKIYEATELLVEAIGTPRTPLTMNVQVAAANGARLRLVEQRQDGVRFPHSIMQAYLGSLLIGYGVEHPRPYNDELRIGFRRPGREFVVALVMLSRALVSAGAAGAAKPYTVAWLRERIAQLGPELPRRQDDVRGLYLRLALAATETAKTDPVKALDLRSAALEADSVDPTSSHEEAAAAVAEMWPNLVASDAATRDAKMTAVARIGEAARRLVDFEFPPPPDEKQDEAPDRDVPAAELEGSLAGPVYGQLFRICCEEPSYPIRLAATQQIGLGGDVAFHGLKRDFRDDMPDSRTSTVRDRAALLRDALADSSEYRPAERRYTVQGWLLPMLVGSIGVEDDASVRLGEWLELVGDGMPLSIEAALAQGFKYAANRRPQHPYENVETRAHLAEAAAGMLEKAEFWFSRLTLLHALCLWGLSGTLYRPRDSGDDRRDNAAVVARWNPRKGDAEHRFVREAAQLVTKALDSGEPERFIWIDESGIATTVGSRADREAPHALQTLWIPESAGWLALDRRAKQLVADILILLNLAEREGTAMHRAKRLAQINTTELPYCLSDERCEHLMPTAATGVTNITPGDKCKSGCPVGLCPYPPKGMGTYRVELDESFCRNQRALLGSWKALRWGRRASWQDAPAWELKRYWTQMEKRARV